MSYFIIGFLEMNVETRSMQAANYAKEIVKVALSYDYSVRFAHQFEDHFYRYVLNPVRELYDNNSANIIEIQLSDSPLTGTIDYGLTDFYKQIAVQQKPSETNLYRFLKELWMKDFINKAVLIFSYGLNSFKSLSRKEMSFDDMFYDILQTFLEGTGDLNSCYIIKK